MPQMQVVALHQCIIQVAKMRVTEQPKKKPTLVRQNRMNLNNVVCAEGCTFDSMAQEFWDGVAPPNSPRNTPRNNNKLSFHMIEDEQPKVNQPLKRKGSSDSCDSGASETSCSSTMSLGELSLINRLFGVLKDQEDDEQQLNNTRRASV